MERGKGSFTNASEDEIANRYLAGQILAMLPADERKALAVLEVTKRLVKFLNSPEAGPTGPARVRMLRQPEDEG